MDRIHIRDLSLKCVIGVFEKERTSPQDVVLNIVLECDLRNAARTDALDQTVDYKAVRDAVVALVKQSRFALIETLAERVASECLKTDGVERATVTVDKPGALRYARSVAAEIAREKKEERGPEGKRSEG